MLYRIGFFREKLKKIRIYETVYSTGEEAYRVLPRFVITLQFEKNESGVAAFFRLFWVRVGARVRDWVRSTPVPSYHHHQQCFLAGTTVNKQQPDAWIIYP